MGIFCLTSDEIIYIAPKNEYEEILSITFHCDGASNTLGLLARTYSRAVVGVMCLYFTCNMQWTRSDNFINQTMPKLEKQVNL